MKLKDAAKKNYVPQEKAASAAEAVKTEEVKVEELDAEVVDVDAFLNVRKTPEIKKGNVITMLAKGTKIIVVDKKPLKSKDGNEWYKIKALDPVLEGYAMKKYIKVY